MSEQRRPARPDPLPSGLQGVPVDVAPPQDAEPALHESHQWYEALFGQMLEGVAYCQMLFDEAGQPADWIYLEVNPAFEALTGLRDVSGKRISQVIPGVRDTNPELFEIFGRVAETGVPEQFETYLPALERWLSIKAYCPEAGHVAAVFENITERKRVDQELRLSQARYKTIVDNIPQKVYVKGPDLRWASVNGLLARDFGLRPEDVVGKTNRELFPQDLADKYSADDRRIIEAGATEEFDEEYLDQGERRMVHSIKTPVRDDSGTIQGVLGVFWDVTDERRAQDELRAANERLKQFFDANIIGALIVRQSGEIIEANDYFLDLIGHTRDEFERGEIDWRGITPPEWLPVSDQAIGEMRARGTYEPYEKEYLRADGTRVPVLVVATALQGRDESIAAFVLDNTERKRAEAEVLALNADLEERVRARTAALEGANRELEAFSYSVSHDLRAPLRSVDGFSKILLQDHGEQLDAEAQRVLGVVIRNVGQMGRLIDDLLAFSRVSRKELERQPVDIDRLARSVSEELRAAEPERAIEVDIGPLGGTLGDSGLLRQVWVNLLGNAFKFTRPMDPSRIEVRCRRSDGECQYTVRDNGVGFDPAYADKLFQPFQRLHQTSKFEGTGIGLAIVARIVRRHDGQVWAEGTPGAGATFGFSLPEQKEET